MYKCVSQVTLYSSRKLVKIENGNAIYPGNIIFFTNDMEHKSYRRWNSYTKEYETKHYTRGGFKIVILNDEDYNSCDSVFQAEILSTTPYSMGMKVPTGKYEYTGEDLFEFVNPGINQSYKITKTTLHTINKLKYYHQDMAPTELLNDILFVVKKQYEFNEVPVEITKQRLTTIERLQKTYNLAIGGVGGEKETALKVFKSLIYKTTEQLLCQN